MLQKLVKEPNNPGVQLLNNFLVNRFGFEEL